MVNIKHSPTEQNPETDIKKGGLSIVVIKEQGKPCQNNMLHWESFEPLKLFWICVFWVTQSSLPCDYRMIFMYVLC